MSLIGKSVRRLEDRPLLIGAGRFAADVKFSDMLCMRVVRSPIRMPLRSEPTRTRTTASTSSGSPDCGTR